MKTANYQQELNRVLKGYDLKDALNVVPGHLYIKDVDGVFLYTNDAFRQGGKLQGEGKTDYDMPWKHDADKLRENDKKVMKNKRQMTFREKLRHQGGGEQQEFISVKAPLFDEEGDVVGIIGHSVPLPKE